MVLVACGPYTTSDSITYEPLLDLIAIINRDRPDVCVLVGSPPGAASHGDAGESALEKGPPWFYIFRKHARLSSFI